MERKKVAIYLDEYIGFIKRIPTEDILNKRVIIRYFNDEIKSVVNKKIKKFLRELRKNPRRMIDVYIFNEDFVMKAIDLNPQVIEFISYKLSENVQLYILDHHPEYLSILHNLTKTMQFETIKRYPDLIQYSQYGWYNSEFDQNLRKELELLAETYSKK